MKKLGFFALLVLWAGAFLISCTGHGREDYVINDFEADADLDRLVWKCRTLYSLSTQYASNGKFCLKLDMYPTAYPGVTFKGYPEDWSRFDALAMNIFNPPENKGDCRITLRIDDQEKTPPYQDRYNGTFLLKPGLNRINIPVGEIKTPRGRPLDLDRIQTFILFTVEPPEKKTLFLDHVRLVHGPE
ncbi:MAG: hypothetical protein KKF30_00140 [Proteobacteria bacterium]|nr:hypothetical protein [Pseudomonadota bacterium]MBU4471071.1 hypothetical protein [Pseudomonadota bacterium]MCG2753671.1 hypothetical protein [Desulfobacteraceae bacterium]